jgi:hypothetical protein
MKLFFMVTHRCCGEQATSPVNEHVLSPNTVTALPFHPLSLCPYLLRIPLPAIGHIAKMPEIL